MYLYGRSVVRVRAPISGCKGSQPFELPTNQSSRPTHHQVELRSALITSYSIYQRMDLTAAIRLKIDRLRTAKTTRYNALSSAVEREVAILTHRSADLFTKLEDALEANVLGNSSASPDELKKEDEGEEVTEEDVDGEIVTDESSIRDRHAENAQEAYEVEEERETYYDHEQEVPAVAIDPANIKNSVTDLRIRAQETQKLLAEKHAYLAQLRTKHDHAMKRLDKLQADLEKVSERWEMEERTRIQTESTTALGKRKREETEDEEGPRKNWKMWGIKSVEWGVLFGVGVVSAVGMSKLQH